MVTAWKPPSASNSAVAARALSRASALLWRLRRGAVGSALSSVLIGISFPISDTLFTGRWSGIKLRRRLLQPSAGHPHQFPPDRLLLLDIGGEGGGRRVRDWHEAERLQTLPIIRQ